MGHIVELPAVVHVLHVPLAGRLYSWNSEFLAVVEFQRMYVRTLTQTWLTQSKNRSSFARNWATVMSAKASLASASRTRSPTLTAISYAFDNLSSVVVSPSLVRKGESLTQQPPDSLI